jgi:hypothetical protein
MGKLADSVNPMTALTAQIDVAIATVLQKAEAHKLKIRRFLSLEPTSPEAMALLPQIDMEQGLPPAVMELQGLERRLYASVDDLARRIAAVETVLKAYDLKDKPSKAAKKAAAQKAVEEAKAVLTKLRTMKSINAENLY